MSVDSKNLVSITGGLVEDPKVRGEKKNVVAIRIAVDFAGRDGTGYFDVTYFLNGGDPRNSKFVAGQLEDGKLKKGSQISVVGRLNQDSWEQDGKKRYNVGIIADNISYASSGRTQDAESGSGGAAEADSSTESHTPKAF